MSDSSPVHVLCARSFTDGQLARLRAVSPRLAIAHRPATTAAELAGVLSPEVEVLYSTEAPVLLDGLPHLRWFQGRAAGVNHIIGTPLWDAGHIALTTASGVHAVTIAEYATGMMIALARDFLGFMAFKRRTHWPAPASSSHAVFPGRELRGATVLIVGYGSIGREIGRQCHALGMRVLAVKRDASRRSDDGFALPGTGDAAGELPERIAGPERLDDLLPEAEYVVLASAYTPASARLIDGARLRLMRPDAFLINIGRGGIVDEPALIRALRDRRIAGAALDVFEKEPLPPDSPLWELDNVILSPHISGVTPRYDEHLVILFAENLRRYLAGEPLLNLVDRTLGY